MTYRQSGKLRRNLYFFSTLLHVCQWHLARKTFFFFTSNRCLKKEITAGVEGKHNCSLTLCYIVYMCGTLFNSNVVDKTAV